MSANSVIEQAVVSGLAPEMPGMAPSDQMAVPERRLIRDNRFLAVYPADAGFDIRADIEPVTRYAIEPNIFFAPRFCLPAVSRIYDSKTYLMVLQDRDRARTETRFLMPFSIEKPGFRIGPDIIRSSANAFGPLGVPLVERRESAQIVEDLLRTLAQPTVRLPKVLVLADVYAESPVVSLFRSVALANNLAIAQTGIASRPWLDASQDANAFFKTAISSKQRRDLGRLWRRLEQQGALEYQIARGAEPVRLAMEEFLLLENAGWKGRRRTSLAADRYQSAFARETVNDLAAQDKCRIHTLTLDGRTVASLIVFVDSGRAWTWKTAFDETLSACAPGRLLMMRATEQFMDDPNIVAADSCANADHPIMGRLWPDRRQMVNLVIGLEPELDRDARRAAAQLELYRDTEQTARRVRDRLNALLKRR